MAVNRILVDFAGWTSAHGIPHIGSAQNNCLRVFWTVIFVASTSMFIFQMVLLIQKYTSYDVTVQTELKFEEREFPSVTMCNLNPYRKEQLNRSPDMKDLMDNYEAAIQGSNSHLDLVNRWGFRQLNDTIAIQSAARDHLLFIAGNMSRPIRDEMTYKLKDPGDFMSGFVLNCAFNTKSCNTTKLAPTGTDTKDFRTIDDPIYGKCYTFNYHKELHLQHKSTRAGPLYGLRLLAVSNQDEYLALTESAGVRVAVHGNDEEPFPDAFGYNAAAGFTTSFGIKFIKTKRLPSPYGNCTDMRDENKYFYHGAYQVEGCFRSCFQRAIQEKCKCSDPRFKIGNPKTDWYCPVFGPARECCDSFNNNNESTGGFNVVQNCQCPQPCTESTYGVTVSTALWPSDVYTPPACNTRNISGKPWQVAMQKAMDDAEPADKELKGTKVCTDWYKENTMLIEVYYERMNYQLLSESEAYTMVNLVSDMGGQLGLWMGISVITVIEFISLLILLCLYCVNKPRDDQVEEIDEKQPHPFNEAAGGANDVNPFDGNQGAQAAAVVAAQ